MLTSCDLTPERALDFLQHNYVSHLWTGSEAAENVEVMPWYILSLRLTVAREPRRTSPMRRSSYAGR